MTSRRSRFLSYALFAWALVYTPLQAAPTLETPDISPLYPGRAFTVNMGTSGAASGSVMVDYRPRASRMDRMALVFDASGLGETSNTIPDSIGLTPGDVVTLRFFVTAADGSRSRSVVTRQIEAEDQALIPNVMGASEEQASRMAALAGFSKGTVNYTVSSTVPEGQVISQAPAAGEERTLGQPVAMVVSSGFGLDLALDPEGKLGVGSEATVLVTLGAPAPVGGLELSLASGNPATVSLPDGATLAVAEGLSTASFPIQGEALGAASITVAGAGYGNNSLVVETTSLLLGVAEADTVPLGGTTSITVQLLSGTAPVGGLEIAVTSENPALVQVETPTVTIPEGQSAGLFTVRGLGPGEVGISVTHPDYASDRVLVGVTAELKILEFNVTLTELLGAEITVQLQSNGSPFVAPPGGVEFTVSSDDAGCIASQTLSIPEGFSNQTVQLEYGGGAASLPCNVVVTVGGGDSIISDTVNVRVNAAPQPYLYFPAFGADTIYSSVGIQSNARIGLGSFDQAIEVTMTIGNGDIARLNSRSNTSEFAVSLAKDSTVFFGGSRGAEVYIEGIAEGDTTLTVDAPGHRSAIFPVKITEGALSIEKPSGPVSVLSEDILTEFRFRVSDGAGNVGNGEPVGTRNVPVTFALSPPGVAALVNSEGMHQQVVVNRIAGDSFNFSIENGGVAFRPLAGGTVTLTASAPGMTSAVKEIVIEAPELRFFGHPTTQALDMVSGLSSARVLLGQHAGTTVTLTSSDPSVLTLSTSASTEGAASIEAPVESGVTFLYYHVHAVGEGTAHVTASAPGFTTAVSVDTVVSSASGWLYEFDLQERTLLSGDRYIWGGVRLVNSSGGNRRPGAPELRVAIANSNQAVGELVWREGVGQTAEFIFDPVPNDRTGHADFQQTVEDGGVLFRPLGVGTSTLSMTAPNGEVITATVNVVGDTFGSNLKDHVGVGLITLSGSNDYVFLSTSGHPGIEVTITSDDATKLLVAPDSSSNGTASAVMMIPAGEWRFSPIFHGVAEGSANVTFSAAGFEPFTMPIRVVPAEVDLSLPSFSLEVYDADRRVDIELGARDPDDTRFFTRQLLRPELSPVDALVTISPDTVAHVVSGENAGGSLTIPLSTDSLSVSQQEFALRGLSAGTATVSVNVPGIGSTSGDVSFVLPKLTTAIPDTGLGLQTWPELQLSARDHPGVTVTLTSANPSAVLLATDRTDAGASSIGVDFPTGSNSSNSYRQRFYVQALEGSPTGTVTVTASAPGFEEASFPVTLVPSFVGTRSSFNTSYVAGTGEARIDVFTGINNNDVLQSQQRRGGGSPVIVTVGSSNPSVGAIVKDGIASESATATVPAGSPSSQSGELTFRPLSGGQTTLSFQNGEFMSLEDPVITVTGVAAQLAPQLLVISAINLEDDGSLRLQLPQALPSSYALQASATLEPGSWVRVPIERHSDNGEVIVSPSSEDAGRLFYRLSQDVDRQTD